MELDERVAELERRVATLEGTAATEASAPRLGEGDFWALETLKEQLAALGAEAGGVLFTGSVRMAAGERYVWQQGALAEELLDRDWAPAADSFAALGHPVRLRLLKEIYGGRRTVAELAELDELGTTGQIYHHLRQLTTAGWLHTRERGRYEVPGTRVVPLLVALSAGLP
ncbi:winged helix-turn-helix transcriptional regulator [Streptomyces sp. S3(2020)]|uniref:ArsR/SmtB family transcription factor n=1 Tax=Streptomyces sp. S3(2020) TaxID=2732044 RepID=UPI001487DB34|nr:helix-turn-helix domain-containing protein [Streptomyces sp. S3(2020)]NNN36650.1 winged helix-turn-helix transcriptional regulator [Streptomyces sp. S3(2020)]